MTVRVRFAPSPTGYLHVGAARTALYNYLFARHNGGTFILRSDDTDTARSTVEFQDDILDLLEWLGLEWDEGIGVGGPHGTYRQSDRYDRYRGVARELVESGKAYYSFATPEQLDGYRAAAREAGTSPAYDGSVEPSAAETADRIAARESAVVRFKVPRPGLTEFTDVVRGDMRFDHAQVDDFVMLRSNGTPTYHLASTVDDVDYEITNVIRGEDLLSSTPKHILLAEAMGATPVTYAHLSLLFGADGKKLSKRHGDTAMAAYRAAGYLPEAMNNYLALLGWNVGDDETIVSLEEMVKRFDLSTVSKNPAVFDHKKLEWMNGSYIREMSDEAFMAVTMPLVEDEIGRELSEEDRASYAGLVPFVKERTKLLTVVAAQARFLFVDIHKYDEKSWQKVMAVEEGPIAIDGAIAVLEPLDEWTTESIEVALRSMLETTGLSARKGFQPVRVAISGSTVSPPLFESLELIGKPATLHRLHAARALLTP